MASLFGCELLYGGAVVVVVRWLAVSKVCTPTCNGMTSSGLRKDRRTPGVYVTEFPAFPPTISGVRTAVPCFIGYTQKAEDPITKKRLYLEAVPIVSMVEFISYFGGAKSLANNYKLKLAAPDSAASAPAPDFKAVSAQQQEKAISLASMAACDVLLQNMTGEEADDAARNSIVFANMYNLYLSMQMFYANGGGFCYVIAVGNYDQPKSKKDLLAGLDQARMAHDATMLVLPDACLLAADDYGAVATAMLGQAGDLRNRVAILDLPSITQTSDSKTLKANSQVFYEKISSAQDAFSFGAAYGPAVQSSFYSSDDLDFQVLADASKESGGSPGTFNLAINHLLTSQAVGLYLSDPAKLNDVLDKVATAYPLDEAKTKPVTSADVEVICNADGREILRKKEGDDAFDTVLTSLKCLATASLDLATATPAPAASSATPAPAPAAAPAPATVTGLCAVRSKDSTSGTEISIPNLDKYLNNATPLLAQIEQVVAKRINVTPPSALLAGVWTKSDANNGVWNAPANMALNMVLRPLVLLNDQEQGDYNIPANGQSISILRAQPGRGTVVWGARTLDGNSNDYRYIQVRRTLIYIEESIKQALQAFVFASNDAQTWTTVTSMISNFLTTLWQAGGLMGSKPNEAFSVACGVPTTMTGLDVLNGYMIVNVSLQLIRPAEFIELTFSQRMQGV